MARYQVEFNKEDLKEVFMFLLVTRAHEYDIPPEPPQDHQTVILDTDTKAVTYHDSEQAGCIHTSAASEQLMLAVANSVGLETKLRAVMMIRKANQLMGGEPTSGEDMLERLMRAKKAMLESGKPERKVERAQTCSEAEHIKRDYNFEGRKIRISTCMSCARAAAEGDTNALAMFMANPEGVRAFIKDWVDMHDARKATKQ